MGYWAKRVKLPEDLAEEEAKFRAVVSTVISDLLYMAYVGTDIVPPSSFIATATVEDFVNNRVITALGARVINRMLARGEEAALDLYASLRYHVVKTGEVPCKFFSSIDGSFGRLCEIAVMHRGEILAHVLQDLLDPLSSIVELAGAKKTGFLLGLLAKFVTGRITSDEYKKLERAFERNVLPGLIRL